MPSLVNVYNWASAALAVQGDTSSISAIPSLFGLQRHVQQPFISAVTVLAFDDQAGLIWARLMADARRKDAPAAQST
jgi:predicted nucleic acid-binding protein